MGGEGWGGNMPPLHFCRLIRLINRDNGARAKAIISEKTCNLTCTFSYFVKRLHLPNSSYRFLFLQTRRNVEVNRPRPQPAAAAAATGLVINLRGGINLLLYSPSSLPNIVRSIFSTAAAAAVEAAQRSAYLHAGMICLEGRKWHVMPAGDVHHSYNID